MITLDLGLYKPEELHVVMAHLRTIGSYIDNSGLDLCRIEADLYGSATAKQILEGRHTDSQYRYDAYHCITGYCEPDEQI